MRLGLVHDDGAAVYLNGREILRRNLKPGAAPEEHASAKVDERAESSFSYSSDIDPRLLADGENVLAVEIHQCDPSSSDISFDLSLGSDAILARAEDLTNVPAARRLEAIRQAGLIGRLRPPAVDYLVGMLRDAPEGARSEAAWTLGEITRWPKESLPALVAALGDGDAGVRDAVARALVRITAEFPECLKDLVADLGSSDPGTREVVCRVLATCGQGVEEAAGALRGLTGDASHAVRHWALAALHPSDPEWAARRGAVAGAEDPAEERHRSFVLRVLSTECSRLLEENDPTPAALARAERYARAALALAPKSGGSLGLLGRVLHVLRRHEEAVEVLTRAVELRESDFGSPDDSSLSLLVAELRELGRNEEAFKYFERLGALRRLRQSGCPCGELRTFGAWVGPHSPGAVVAVDFSMATLREPEVRSAVELLLPSLLDLEDLNLAGTAAGDAFVERLSGSRRLVSLNLDGTWISAKALGYVGRISSLRRLNVSRTEVNDPGIQSLGGLVSLESLWLSGTKVTDAGLSRLASLPRLERLYLEETSVGDAGLSRLARLRSLKSLHLGGSRPSAEAIGRLRSVLPDVEIRSERRSIAHLRAAATRPVMGPVHCLDDSRSPGLLEADALAFVDRLHEYKGADGAGLPSFLPGAEYVRTAGDASEDPGFTLEIELTSNADIYLFLDNRAGDPSRASDASPDLGNGTMDWVGAMGFVDTGQDLGLDEHSDAQERAGGAGQSIDATASIFVLKNAAPGWHKLGAQNAGPVNMYGVAVVPVR